MSELVMIPWQPGYYLTPSTLKLLEEACNVLGGHIMVTDAWRSYAEQAYYYDQYINHGGPPASNPDTGQRNHMRGAAFDSGRTDLIAQAAFRKVGLIRDAVESWHWNDPNWQNMPVIPTNTNTAGGGATPLPTPSPTEEEDMKGKFLRAPDTSMGYIGPSGVLIPLKDMDEVRSYEYIGWADQKETQSVSQLVWNKLSAAASRTK